MVGTTFHPPPPCLKVSHCRGRLPPPHCLKSPTLRGQASTSALLKSPHCGDRLPPPPCLKVPHCGDKLPLPLVGLWGGCRGEVISCYKWLEHKLSIIIKAWHSIAIFFSIYWPFLQCSSIHVNPPWSSGRLPEMRPKISSKTYHFLSKFGNLPHLN